MSGEKDVMAMASAHIRAPLSRCHPDPDVLITWFIDPAKGGSINTGYLYHLGPYNGNVDEEEWMFACAMDPNGPRFGREEMLRRLQETLKLPQEVGVRVDLLSVSHWAVNAVVADRFRSPGGRVFVVGDAAHRIPPWGALGLNTGVQDVQNLVWKLAFSIRNHHIGENHEPNSLLNTYEEERRPIALRVAQTSLSNLRNHALAMDRALGIDPGQPVEENIASFNAYFDKAHPAHQRTRDTVLAAQKVLDSEFHAPGGETGWFYKSANIHNEDHGGQITETGEFDIYTYHPSTTPGHHMPHFWIAKNGVRKSVRDLLRRDKFVLFARSARWEIYKSEVDEIHTEILDGKDSNWRDEENRWGLLPGLDENQALLVRPDGIIAWRMHGVGSMSTGDYAKICMREILRYLSA
ncbi:FAD binding domain-containing protein [Aspergillus aurantiobrunneus]